MKPVNIFSLSLSSNFDIHTFNLTYTYQTENSSLTTIKDREKTDLKSFVREIYKFSHNISIFDGFCFSFTIPQISKEFDLLKITENGILNIEFKSQQVDESQILRQLIQNRHYLHHLSENIVNITYVRNENKFYLLSSDKLEIIKSKDMFDILVEFSMYHIINTDIEELFKPKVFLISPLNDTDAFIDREYFLTDHQEKIKANIIKNILSSNYRYFPLDGDAGTGKTLLMYDIAREISDKINILFIHCGELCTGHFTLSQKLNINIISENNFKFTDLDSYSVIFIDEGHRIKPKTFDLLIKSGKKIVFAVDIKQCTKDIDSAITTSEKLRTLKKVRYYHLTNTIRINRELSAFNKNMFNLMRVHPQMKYKNINVFYAESMAEFNSLIKYLIDKVYIFINYQHTKKNVTDKYSDNLTTFNTSNVAGQEFDKVAMFVDRRFYYDNNILTSHDSDKFILTKLLYQGLTRCREKLTLICYKNKDIYLKLMDILTKNNIKEDDHHHHHH